MGEFVNGWVWLGFSIFVIVALSIDTFFLSHHTTRPHQSMRAALAWTLVWVSLALLFNLLLWFYLYEMATPVIAHEAALNFFTGYLIEKSLSVDNLFVFYLIFKQLHIPPMYQQRVFSYGIWGAIVMRLVLILLGTWLVSRFHWILYIMGVFLLFTGIKMLLIEEKEKDITQSAIINLVKRYFRVTHEFSGESFFVKINKLWYATPLFVALVMIEFSDLIFATDSIPAIFAITQDPFIVWTSNIFAILGLRALYFLLAGMLSRFSLLKYAIALILTFIGAKMVIEPWYDMPVAIALSVVATLLVAFTIASWIRERHQGKR